MITDIASLIIPLLVSSNYLLPIYKEYNVYGKQISILHLNYHYILVVVGQAIHP